MKESSFFGKAVLVCSFLSLMSCGHTQTVEVCDPNNGASCVTIMDVSNDRRFIYFELPHKYDENYVELNISDVDRLTDGIFVRWVSGKVYASNPGSQLVSENLDKSRFTYFKSLPLNKRGMPNAKLFHESGFEINMFSNSVYPTR